MNIKCDLDHYISFCSLWGRNHGAIQWLRCIVTPFCILIEFRAHASTYTQNPLYRTWVRIDYCYLSGIKQLNHSNNHYTKVYITVFLYFLHVFNNSEMKYHFFYHSFENINQIEHNPLYCTWVNLRNIWWSIRISKKSSTPMMKLYLQLYLKS